MNTITFDPVYHRYTIDGIEVPSVTQKLATIKPKFDALSNATRVAVREGVQTDVILAKWEQNRQNSLTRGKVLHSYIEQELLTGKNPSEWTFESASWLIWWLTCKIHLTPVKVESIIGSLEWKIAGTMDALMLSAKTNKHHVIDWKSGKEFRTVNQYSEMLLPPFDDLHNCEQVVYSLQTSIYRALVEREGIDCGDSWIVHVTADRATPYRATDYRERVLQWLTK